MKQHPLVGKVVEIEWQRPRCGDWYRFKVLAVSPPFVRLQGLRQDGDDYDGRPIWVPVASLDCMKEE